jgi:hypothetical protein
MGDGLAQMIKCDREEVFRKPWRVNKLTTLFNPPPTPILVPQQRPYPFSEP